MEGYIKLYRKIKENKYWLEPRKFSKAEAWIDLLLRAGFKDKELVLGNQNLNLKAGEFVTSQAKLAEAWKWDRETVNAYLRRLKADEMLGYRTSNKFTVITICNWDNYQNPDKENPATNPTANPAALRQQNRQQTDNKTDTINNGNKDNNVKNDKNKERSTADSASACPDSQALPASLGESLEAYKGRTIETQSELELLINKFGRSAIAGAVEAGDIKLAEGIEIR